jgi:hypothetical protein
MEISRLNRTNEVQVCRILRSDPSNCPAFDLRVRATPMELDGESFTILAIRDIADEKRRECLNGYSSMT